MYSYDFRLDSGDRNVGTVYLPERESLDLPVMVYSHGWGDSRRLWPAGEKIRDKAINAGMAFVTFDYFGCGETGGDYREMTYSRWKNNLAEIVSWAESQPFADRRKIGCYAVSSGSTAALRFAAQDDRLAFIISVGTCITAHIGMGKGGIGKILADNLAELTSGGTVEALGVDFGIGFYLDTLSGAPMNTMDKIKCPVLFLQGANDNPCRCADAKLAYDLMKRAGLRADYTELPGGEHTLDNMPEETAAIAMAWVKQII